MDKKSDIRIYKNYIAFKEFQPLKCWKAGLSYGSVIYFEMKDRIFESGLSSYIGSASLWINADEWTIYHNNKEQLYSTTIIEEDASFLNNLFFRKRFLEIKDNTDQNALDIFFEDMQIRVFKFNNNSDDLITFFLPNGKIFYYSDNFYESFEIDETRYLFGREEGIWRNDIEHKYPNLNIAYTPEEFFAKHNIPYNFNLALLEISKYLPT
ncbi:MAG TPA: hypothetical protein DCQ37_18180 [Desulfobacteraceae bacterium]|nr:hypothetical protein [Desulfobacteraceae bacterium]